MMEKLSILQRVQLNKVLFPHVEFECLETEPGQLLAPQFQVATDAFRLDERHYVVEIEALTDREEPASFRALVLLRLELSLTDDGPEGDEGEMLNFFQINGLVLAWPYLRELISSATVRMGLPALFIPMLDVTKIVVEPSREGPPTADDPTDYR